MRLAFALLLALFVGQALIQPASAAIEVCTQSCADDRPDGTCDPTCGDCSCCQHGAQPPVAISETPALEPLADRASGEVPAPSVPSSDPRDVFHVPRSLV